MKHTRFAPRARRDVAGIRDWIARDNPLRAVSYVDELIEHCRRLAEQPMLGRARPELGQGFRFMRHGNFVIYYRPAASGIDVLRVVHGRRDTRRGLQLGCSATGSTLQSI